MLFQSPKLIFPKGFTHDFGKKQLIFSLLKNLENKARKILNNVVDQKEAFLD